MQGAPTDPSEMAHDDPGGEPSSPPLRRSRLVLAGLGAMVLALTAFALFLVLGWGKDHPGAGLVDRYGYNAVCLLPAVMVLWRGLTVRADRALWLPLGAALAAYELGNLYWFAFLWQDPSPAFPSPADVGWALFYVLSLAGVGHAVRAGMRRAPAGVWVDGLLAGLAVVSVAATFVLPPVLAASDGALPAILTNAAYLVGDVVLFASLVSVCALRGWRPGGALVLLMAGVAVRGVSDTGYLLQVANNSYTSGTPLDLGWTLGLSLIALAAWTGPRPAPTARPADWRAIALPVGFAVASLVVLLSSALGSRHLAGSLLAAGAVVVALGRMVMVFGQVRSAAVRQGRLEHAHQQLVSSSRRDVLTGLRNRRALAEDLDEVDADRAGRSITVALCDIDYFKAYNDSLGHLAGDDALRRVAIAVTDVLRPADVAYRYGGEELLLLLEGLDQEDGGSAAERVRAAVKQQGLAHPSGVDGVITLSVGVAGGDAPVRELLERADAALYEAKADGRDRVRGGCGTSSVPRKATFFDDPVVRQLTALTGLTTLALDGAAPEALLERVARIISAEFGYGTVVVNLVVAGRSELLITSVVGDAAARTSLLGARSTLEAWRPLLECAGSRSARRACAVWLPSGTVDCGSAIPTWLPEASPLLEADAWRPEDMLLVALEDEDGDLVAVLSLDEPRTARRPAARELELVAAIGDHAAALLDRAAVRA